MDYFGSMMVLKGWQEMRGTQRKLRKSSHGLERSPEKERCAREAKEALTA